MARILNRAEDLGLHFCFLALLLAETGYVAWLERAPAFRRRSSKPPLSLCHHSMDGQGLK